VLLKEKDEEAKLHKKQLTELQKQYDILNEFSSTLKLTLQDKETELDKLRSDRLKIDEHDYPSTVQRLKEEISTLNQKIYNLQHKKDLLQLEYENKLEVAELKATLTKGSIELEMYHKQKYAEVKPSMLAPKRGRPPKEKKNPNKPHDPSPTDQTEDITEDFEDPYVPDIDELQNELNSIEQEKNE